MKHRKRNRSYTIMTNNFYQDILDKENSEALAEHLQHDYDEECEYCMVLEEMAKVAEEDFLQSLLFT